MVRGAVALFFLPHFFFYGKEKQGKKREKASEREREIRQARMLRTSFSFCKLL